MASSVAVRPLLSMAVRVATLRLNMSRESLVFRNLVTVVAKDAVDAKVKAAEQLENTQLDIGSMRFKPVDNKDGTFTVYLLYDKLNKPALDSELSEEGYSP